MSKKTAILWSQLCVIVLILTAAVVFIGLTRSRNMWIWICVYWAVLTVKNIFDFVASEAKQ